MKKFLLPIGAEVMISDPADPSRPMAYHVVVAQVVDLEDGSALIIQEKTAMSPKQLDEAGLKAPDIFELFGSKADAARLTAESERDAAMGVATDVQKKLDEALAANATLAAQVTALQTGVREMAERHSANERTLSNLRDAMSPVTPAP